MQTEKALLSEFLEREEFIFYNVKNVMSDIYIKRKCELLFRVNRAYPFDLLRYIIPFSINYPTVVYLFSTVAQLSYYSYISHYTLKIIFSFKDFQRKISIWYSNILTIYPIS